MLKSWHTDRKKNLSETTAHLTSFFIVVWFLPAICFTIYAIDKKANFPFSFVCSARKAEGVRNQLPCCCGLTEYFC